MFVLLCRLGGGHQNYIGLCENILMCCNLVINFGQQRLTWVTYIHLEQCPQLKIPEISFFRGANFHVGVIQYFRNNIFWRYLCKLSFEENDLGLTCVLKAFIKQPHQS